MPKQLLPVKHFIQERTNGCLAACTQMVLDHSGIAQSQTQLNHLFELQDIGTPLSRIKRLEEVGICHVTVQIGDETDIYQAVQQNTPLILFISTGQLSYWKDDVQHAIVVVGYDDEYFWLNDPAFPDAPKRVLADEVMLAWLEFDYRYAMLTK